MKELTWKYVEPLKTDLKKFEMIYNISLPNDFVEYITKYNAGIVEPHKFDLENEKGKVFGGFLSFNTENSDGEELVSDIIEDLELYKNSELKALPFGLDPFGNMLY